MAGRGGGRRGTDRLKMLKTEFFFLGGGVGGWGLGGSFRPYIFTGGGGVAGLQPLESPPAIDPPQIRDRFEGTKLY